ncbi:hypothetical protein PR048_004671 [Dryococelus australis]|uniref:Mutator-like transposase domain-containing protein n=1 Tax=Dryococelus australis TaxID=614101 RepID=A0ABQ9I623_9NEOP|nr:hypothetical protein PR048_004671 [Dryococelus australis]
MLHQTSQNTCPTSASKTKFNKHFEDMCDLEENVVDSSNLGYVLFDMNIFSKVLADFVCRNGCGGQIIVEEATSGRNGLATIIVIICTHWKSRKKFATSKQCINNLYEANFRLFYAMRAIGKGLSASETFYALMNLPPPSTRIQKYSEIIVNAVESVASSSIKAAAKEAVELNEGCNDVPIAFDGTWQKRGHTSKILVATHTSVNTGKIIDFEALTKHCYCFDGNTSGEHKNYHKNYEGTSGGMEVDAPDVEIKKVECVGHAQKRMGTCLRKLKHTLCTTVLLDRKLLTGRLTDKTINELQQYYDMAIRNNIHDLESMRKAVWAIYFYKLSNDEKPIHSLCPSGPNTQCKVRKYEALGKSFKHNDSLPEVVMEAIKPTYRDLAHPDLLRKCLNGRTQNPNESFNNIIWSRVPKNLFVGLKNSKLGVGEAVLTFNDGNIGRIRVLKLNIVPGIHMVKGL